MRLSWVVGVKLLNLDFLFVLVGIVEDDHLHCALERCWVLEVYREATLAKLVLWLLPGLLKLASETLEGRGWWGLSTLLSNFVGGTRGLDLKVDLLVLIFFGLRLDETFVPDLVLVLQLFLLRRKLILLTLLKLLIIFRIFLFLLDIGG